MQEISFGKLLWVSGGCAPIFTKLQVGVLTIYYNIKKRGTLCITKYMDGLLYKCKSLYLLTIFCKLSNEVVMFVYYFICANSHI